MKYELRFGHTENVERRTPNEHHKVSESKNNARTHHMSNGPYTQSETGARLLELLLN